MASIKKSGIFRKWWVRTIRERNYFGFRYWWFNWLFLLAAIFLFWFFYFKSEDSIPKCQQVDEINATIEQIRIALENCCTCEKKIEEPIPEEPPKPKDSTVVECPDRVLAFQVCNSNAEKDDNFDVYLNGVKIGKLDLNTDDKVGSVFLATNDRSITIERADFICPIRNMSVYYFDPKIVKFGKNKLLLKNTQNNGNGNRGDIEIRNYLLTGNKLTNPCKITNLPFAPAAGANFSVDFKYTKCCE